MTPTDDEVRRYLSRLADLPGPTTREEIRATMAGRKAEELRANRDTLRRVEARAIRLIARPDYRSIRPTLRWVAPRDRPVWRYLRATVSSAPFTGAPGRWLPAFAVDEASGGILGVVELRSDISALGPRDRAIGWTHDDRFRRGRLRSVAGLSTCVAVPPFGALTGVKAMAAMVTSTEAARAWEGAYGDPLAAVATTALYGKSSAYNRLREWDYVGVSTGASAFHLPDAHVRWLSRWLTATGRDSGAYWGTSGSGGGRYVVVRTAAHAFGFDLDDVFSRQPRGVYLALLGDSAGPYLRCERDALTPDTEPLAAKVDYWLDRWYAMRLPKVSDRIDAFDPDAFRVDRALADADRLYRDAPPVPDLPDRDEATL